MALFVVRHEHTPESCPATDPDMWGQDYPHAEGTYPYTTEALRNTFSDVPTDEVAAMPTGDAARPHE